jgi:hypothetical protein
MRNVQLLLASLVATGTTLLTTSALTLAQEPAAVDEPITLFGLAYVGFVMGAVFGGAVVCNIIRRRYRNPSTGLPARPKSRRARGPGTKRR